MKLAVLSVASLLAFGILIGHSLTVQALERRSRRQDLRQRDLQEWEHELEVREQSNALLQDTRRPPDSNPDDERPTRRLSAQARKEP